MTSKRRPAQSRIFDQQSLLRQISEWREKKATIVFTNGCFDILHAGHIKYLESAAALGDYLIVAVNDDDSVSRLKGKSRPINQLHSRLFLLASLSTVDGVVPFEEDSPLSLIQLIRPDILAKGGDYNPDTVVGAQEVLAYGGKVEIIPFVEGYSTTKLERRIIDLHNEKKKGFMSTLVSEVVDFLESIAPLHLQEKYDNAGLLIGSGSRVVTGTIVSLDCTEAVLDEAIANHCNLIISHHPAIFYGVKRITGSNVTERIIEKAIRHQLNIYAIHTNLDNTLTNGVNEQIARRLGLEVDGILRTREGGNPLEGAGIIGYFPVAMQEDQFLRHVRERMKTGVIRHTALINKPIERVAVCGGSGSFLIQDAIKAGVQALVTADMKYHQFFDADGEILICDIGHYESEQYTVNLLQELVSANFTTFAAHCTGINTNPVHYYT